MSDLATVAVELILTETQSSDAGNYSCRATNAADRGEDSQSFQLLVEGKKNTAITCFIYFLTNLSIITLTGIILLYFY